MKIIAVDNFDRDSESDELIAENVPEHWANRIVSLLNEKVGRMSRDYFRAVSDDYKLYVWEP